MNTAVPPYVKPSSNKHALAKLFYNFNLDAYAVPEKKDQHIYLRVQGFVSQFQHKPNVYTVPDIEPNQAELEAHGSYVQALWVGVRPTPAPGLQRGDLSSQLLESQKKKGIGSKNSVRDLIESEESEAINIIDHDSSALRVVVNPNSQHVQFFALVNPNSIGICETIRVLSEEVFFDPLYREDALTSRHSRALLWPALTLASSMTEAAQQLLIQEMAIGKRREGDDLRRAEVMNWKKMREAQHLERRESRRASTTQKAAQEKEPARVERQRLAEQKRVASAQQATEKERLAEAQRVKFAEWNRAARAQHTAEKMKMAEAQNALKAHKAAEKREIAKAQKAQKMAEKQTAATSQIAMLAQIAAKKEQLATVQEAARAQKALEDQRAKLAKREFELELPQRLRVSQLAKAMRRDSEKNARLVLKVPENFDLFRPRDTSQVYELQHILEYYESRPTLESFCNILIDITSCESSLQGFGGFKYFDDLQLLHLSSDAEKILQEIEQIWPRFPGSQNLDLQSLGSLSSAFKSHREFVPWDQMRAALLLWAVLSISLRGNERRIMHKNWRRSLLLLMQSLNSLSLVSFYHMRDIFSGMFEQAEAWEHLNVHDRPEKDHELHEDEHPSERNDCSESDFSSENDDASDGDKNSEREEGNESEDGSEQDETVGLG
ncbi:hypothetical protein BT63DRAFT_460228 [Microthyrium microscopicum]|uniref:Uncharacterized protein n=1 Tax=Microthyrium microscopicum TaxID=703497 RepID=A0A6A6TXA9_9PEZI|nr:hypothetical protein BT63DRAFT_460228 [Microthyrium microscopicum]